MDEQIVSNNNNSNMDTAQHPSRSGVWSLTRSRPSLSRSLCRVAHFTLLLCLAAAALAVCFPLSSPSSLVVRIVGQQSMRTLSLDDAAVFLASTHNDRDGLHRMLAADHPEQLRDIVSSLDSGRNRFQLDTEVNVRARRFLAMALEELGRLEAGEPLTSELSTFDGSNLRDAQGRIVSPTPDQQLEIEAEEARR